MFLFPFRIRIFDINLNGLAVIEHHLHVINALKVIKVEESNILFAASKDGTISVWLLDGPLPSFYNKFDSPY